jgi:hypothetical protein
MSITSHILMRLANALLDWLQAAWHDALSVRFTGEVIVSGEQDGWLVSRRGRRRAYIGRVRIPYWLALRLRHAAARRAGR